MRKFAVLDGLHLCIILNQLAMQSKNHKQNDLGLDKETSVSFALSEGTLSLAELLQELNDFQNHFFEQIGCDHASYDPFSDFTHEEIEAEKAFKAIRNILKLRIADGVVSDLRK